MDLSFTPPNMRASELFEKATAFAQELATELEKLNQSYPMPQIDPEDWEHFTKLHGGAVPGPTPRDLILTFETAFCHCVASHWVIIPDEELPDT